jgi:hypothetical protein
MVEAAFLSTQDGKAHRGDSGFARTVFSWPGSVDFWLIE